MYIKTLSVVAATSAILLTGCGDSASPIFARDFETSRRTLDPVMVDGTSYRRVEITSTFDNGDVYVDEWVYVEGQRFRCEGDCAAAVERGLMIVQEGGGSDY